jgi:hypothetical protein
VPGVARRQDRRLSDPATVEHLGAGLPAVSQSTGGGAPIRECVGASPLLLTAHTSKLRPLEEHPRPPSLPRREVDVTVKIAVEVHRAAKLAAIARGMPLFAFVEEALREKLARTEGSTET